MLFSTRVSPSRDPNLSLGVLRVPAQVRRSTIVFQRRAHCTFSQDHAVAWTVQSLSGITQFVMEAAPGVRGYQGFQPEGIVKKSTLHKLSFCSRRRPSLAGLSFRVSILTGSTLFSKGGQILGSAILGFLLGFFRVIGESPFPKFHNFLS